MRKYAFGWAVLLVWGLGAGSVSALDCETIQAFEAQRPRVKFGRHAAAVTWQGENFHLFQQVIDQTFDAKPRYQTLPTGLPADLATYLGALFRIRVAYPEILFRTLQGVERAVVDRAEQGGYSLEEAWEKQLQVYESYIGFGDPERVTKWLGQRDFLSILASGRLITDTFWLDKDHTRDIHRIGPIVDALYLETIYGVSEEMRGIAVRVHRAFGNWDYELGYDWSNTGVPVTRELLDAGKRPDLWMFMNDTPYAVVPEYVYHARNYTNPDFIALLRVFLPGLAGWK